MGNIHPLFLILKNLRWLLFTKFIVLRSYFADYIYAIIKKTTIILL